MSFTCPNCGGNEWGTSNCTSPREDMIGHCHTYYCKFQWPRTDDHLYFKDESQEFNSGHIAEAMQTCHIAMSIISDNLDEHPAIVEADMQDKLMKAEELIMECYQAIGNLE